MSVTELERTELVNQLVAAIGKGPAETLMQCVLTEGRDQLATKDDLRAFATKEDLREALKVYVTKEDLEVGLRVLGAEMRSYVDRALLRQTRTYVMAMVGFAVSTWAAIFVQPLVY